MTTLIASTPYITCPSLAANERHRQAGEECEPCRAYRKGYDAATYRARQSNVLARTELGRLRQELRRLRG